MKNLSRDLTHTIVYPVKVLQFGDGNFLRGFSDWVIDILNERMAFRGSVIVVAPLRRGRKVVDEQQGLYHVVLRGLSEGKMVDDYRLVSCVTDYVNPYDEFDRFLSVADETELQFVISNTTEAGITFDPQDSNLSQPAVSFPAKVTQLLYRRFLTFGGDLAKGLVFLPCELIEFNATTLRQIVLQYAGLWNLPREFTDWVNNACRFCNTLVDRIVTGYPKEEAEQICRRTGYRDNKLVMAEPYHLWAIEAGPSLNDIFPVKGSGLNVKFVDDLAPYRTTKVRILNGAHTAMTLIGYLRGLRTVRSSVEDPWMSSFLERMIREEVIPTIPLPVEEVELYASQVFERFRNPSIVHELKSIALNSVSKFRARLLPTILDYYQQKGQAPPLLTQAFAALIVFYRGMWKGETLPVNDHPDAVTALQRCWDSENNFVGGTLLADTALWGTPLSHLPNFEEELSDAVARVLSGF